MSTFTFMLLDVLDLYGDITAIVSDNWLTYHSNLHLLELELDII